MSLRVHDDRNVPIVYSIFWAEHHCKCFKHHHSSEDEMNNSLTGWFWHLCTKHLQSDNVDQHNPDGAEKRIYYHQLYPDGAERKNIVPSQ